MNPPHARRSWRSWLSRPPRRSWRQAAQPDRYLYGRSAGRCTRLHQSARADTKHRSLCPIRGVFPDGVRRIVALLAQPGPVAHRPVRLAKRRRAAHPGSQQHIAPGWWRDAESGRAARLARLRAAGYHTALIGKGHLEGTRMLSTFETCMVGRAPGLKVIPANGLIWFHKRAVKPLGLGAYLLILVPPQFWRAVEGVSKGGSHDVGMFRRPRVARGEHACTAD
jgi:hypothetical protein